MATVLNRVGQAYQSISVKYSVNTHLHDEFSLLIILLTGGEITSQELSLTNSQTRLYLIYEN